MIDAKLILVGDKKNKPTTIKLKKLPMTIGRGREADLTLAHPMVSRLHCELYEVDGTLCIRDMGSLNGTFVGDIRITEASLESGDVLTIGEAVFKVHIGGGTVEEEIMPPDADSKETTADDSFIEMAEDEIASSASTETPQASDSAPVVEPDEDETGETDLPARARDDAVTKSTDQEEEQEEPEEKEPERKDASKKKKKAAAEAPTIDFERIEETSANADDADDDDLNDFLSSLK